jgi:hypothetical protein
MVATNIKMLGPTQGIHSRLNAGVLSAGTLLMRTLDLASTRFRSTPRLLIACDSLSTR